MEILAVTNLSALIRNRFACHLRRWKYNVRSILEIPQLYREGCIFSVKRKYIVYLSVNHSYFLREIAEVNYVKLLCSKSPTENRIRILKQNGRTVSKQNIL